MRGIVAFVVAGLSAWPVVARAWQSGEHFTITHDVCMAMAAVRPANPARPWAEIAAIANRSYGVNGHAANWNENFCVSLASASADADVDAFDDDLAHTQTKYVGGVNFIGRAVGAANMNINHGNFDLDPRRINNTASRSRLPPPVQRTPPTDMVREWLTYFRDWSQHAVADFQGVPWDKDVKNKWWRGTVIIRVWYIPWNWAHDDPANSNPVYPLGRLLHQIQDSCTHQGITGYQHSFAAYELATNPDTTSVGPRRTNCTIPVTQAFFQALAAYIASWSGDKLAHLSMSDWAVRGAPLARPSYYASTATARIATTIATNTVPWRQNIDYLYQLCDMPCRDFQGPGPAISCTNSKLNAGSLKQMWLDAIGNPNGTMMFNRSANGWATLLNQQVAAHTNAAWLLPNAAFDQPALGNNWWFIRQGEMWLLDSQAPKAAKGLTLGCPGYGNRTAPFWRAKFTGAGAVVDPAQWKCNPNYEGSFTAAPVAPGVECRRWRNAAVPPAGAANVIETNAAPFRDMAGVHTLNYDYNCRYYQARVNNVNKYCKNNGTDDPAAETP